MKLVFGLLALVATLVISQIAFANDLSIAVQPGGEVLLGPGPAASCLDRANAVQSGGMIQRSVVGPVSVFNNFQLMWSSNDAFYVQELRATFTGSGIKGGVYKTALSADELDALLALPTGVISGAMTGPLNSSDPGRPRQFPPCGLALGGIPLADPTAAQPFKGTITIDVIGTREDAFGNQQMVTSTVKSSFRFEGIR